VLGKAGCRIGGRTIDGWLYADLLSRAKIHDIDARSASALFMLEVERIKERLSSETSCVYDIRHKPTSLHLKGVYHRSELEDLLEKNGLYHDVQETLERAMKDARERGADKGDIKEALMVGGTSYIPSIRRQVTTLFGAKVRFYRPYDAVARGACRYLSSDVEALYDHIQHDYAIKSYDKRSGTYTFIPIIPRGTKYPTKEGFKKITMKATRVGQRFFGIDIYEIAQKGNSPSSMGEVIFDGNGGVIFDNNPHGMEVLTEFWMNENNPTFIEADPPAQQTDTPRFAVSFRVDSQKHLLVTVRDIHNQKLMYDDFPVVKLK
jgi:molecular chaperone DnaK (HSP70)